MSKENRATIQRGPHPIWFNALLLLDAFALGGLAVWRFVLTFMESAMTGFVTPSGEIFHVLDKLLPYWLGHTGISLVLLLITAGGYLWLRTRSAVASALTVIIPIALMVWFWISRGG
jgi:hypothetical protein